MSDKIIRFPRTESKLTSKVIASVIEGINKSYKKRKQKMELTTLRDSVFSEVREYVPSGILPLDCVVAYGKGFPIGIVEIYGAEHSGKTAIMEHTFAVAQRLGYYTLLFPMEYSVDYKRAESVGIDVDKLIVFEDAETIEDIYDLIIEAVNQIRKDDQETPIVIGWDTVASTPTRSELDNKKGLAASDMGKMAAQMSKLFRRLIKFLFKNKVCLLCLNQTRTNLGQMYGDKETTYGGKALRFYSWVRLRIKTVKTLKDSEDEEIGILSQITCRKNKVAPPFRSCLVPLYWKRGIDPIKSIWEHCTEHGIFRKQGTQFYAGSDLITRKTFPKYYLRNKDHVDNILKEHYNGVVS